MLREKVLYLDFLRGRMVLQRVVAKRKAAADALFIHSTRTTTKVLHVSKDTACVRDCRHERGLPAELHSNTERSLAVTNLARDECLKCFVEVSRLNKFPNCLSCPTCPTT